MTSPFLGEIRMLSFGFAPKGYALCNGQLLPINQNQAMFSLLGTVYGGDGRVNFGLPNLQGKVPIMFGSGHTLGEQGGEYAHSLSISEMATHIHVMQGTAANANAALPGTGNSVAQGHATGTGQPQVSIFGAGSADRAFAANALGSVGGSQPHNNQQPVIVLAFCIALQGIFPSQT